MHNRSDRGRDCRTRNRRDGDRAILYTWINFRGHGRGSSGWFNINSRIPDLADLIEAQHIDVQRPRRAGVQACHCTKVHPVDLPGVVVDIRDVVDPRAVDHQLDLAPVAQFRVQRPTPPQLDVIPPSQESEVIRVTDTVVVSHDPCSHSVHRSTVIHVHSAQDVIRTVPQLEQCELVSGPHH